MLSGKQRAEIQRRFRVLRAGAPGRPSQVEIELDCELATGKYFRIENGYVEATPDERGRIAQRFGCSAEQIPTFTEMQEAMAS